MIRLDPYRVRIEASTRSIQLFASPEVYVDRKSVDEILAFAALDKTLDDLRRIGFIDADAGIERIILTPDFHKGAGIPIGTVFRSQGFAIPRSIGSDGGCGMRFLMTDVSRDEFDSLGNKLDHILRYIFFEGGRNIPLSRQQREAIFKVGIPGLLELPHSGEGIWEYWDQESVFPSGETDHHHNGGGFPARTIFEMSDFIRGSGGEYTRDDQIGSIGGGNHFCEFQVVEEVIDRRRAYDWRIRRDKIAIMVHSGSVGIGHVVGNHFTDWARSIYPSGLKHHNDFYLIPDRFSDPYLEALWNAANFAIVNRLFLGLMMVRALSEALGRRVHHDVVYDAPHNLVWVDDRGFLHRKGACPAGQAEPVLVPGSMGTSSYIMVGHGSEESFCSACHGAGRIRPRQGARKLSQNPCRVISKIDPHGLRKEIRDDYMKSLAEEAPEHYKDVLPVIQTIEGAGIATRVARTFPLLTVKGL